VALRTRAHRVAQPLTRDSRLAAPENLEEHRAEAPELARGSVRASRRNLRRQKGIVAQAGNHADSSTEQRHPNAARVDSAVEPVARVTTRQAVKKARDYDSPPGGSPPDWLRIAGEDLVEGAPLEHLLDDDAVPAVERAEAVRFVLEKAQKPSSGQIPSSPASESPRTFFRRPRTGPSPSRATQSWQHPRKHTEETSFTNHNIPPESMTIMLAINFMSDHRDAKATLTRERHPDWRRDNFGPS
jgi:hypothetical protein